MSMIQLIYVSAAVTKFTEDELTKLMHQARDNNKTLQLTGMLLYLDGNFIQVLEGEEKSVNDLYNIIDKDKRHTGNIVLLRKKINERNFPDWTMGFKSLSMDEASDLLGYKNLRQDIFKVDNSDNMQHPAVKLLQKFYTNNG